MLLLIKVGMATHADHIAPPTSNPGYATGVCVCVCVKVWEGVGQNKLRHSYIPLAFYNVPSKSIILPCRDVIL